MSTWKRGILGYTEAVGPEARKCGESGMLSSTCLEREEGTCTKEENKIQGQWSRTSWTMRCQVYWLHCAFVDKNAPKSQSNMEKKWEVVRRDIAHLFMKCVCSLGFLFLPLLKWKKNRNLGFYIFSYNICWSYSFNSPTPLRSFHPYPPNIMFFLLKNKTKQNHIKRKHGVCFALANYSRAYCLPGARLVHPMSLHWKHWLPLSPQLSIAKGVLVRDTTVSTHPMVFFWVSTVFQAGGSQLFSRLLSSQNSTGD